MHNGTKFSTTAAASVADVGPALNFAETAAASVRYYDAAALLVVQNFSRALSNLVQALYPSATDKAEIELHVLNCARKTLQGGLPTKASVETLLIGMLRADNVPLTFNHSLFHREDSTSRSRGFDDVSVGGDVVRRGTVSDVMVVSEEQLRHQRGRQIYVELGKLAETYSRELAVAVRFSRSPDVIDQLGLILSYHKNALTRDDVKAFSVGTSSTFSSDVEVSYDGVKGSLAAANQAAAALREDRVYDCDSLARARSQYTLALAALKSSFSGAADAAASAPLATIAAGCLSRVLELKKGVLQQAAPLGAVVALGMSANNASGSTVHVLDSRERPGSSGSDRSSSPASTGAVATVVRHLFVAPVAPADSALAPK